MCGRPIGLYLGDFRMLFVLSYVNPLHVNIAAIHSNVTLGHEVPITVEKALQKMPETGSGTRLFPPAVAVPERRPRQEALPSLPGGQGGRRCSRGCCRSWSHGPAAQLGTLAGEMNNGVQRAAGHIWLSTGNSILVENEKKRI